MRLSGELANLTLGLRNNRWIQQTCIRIPLSLFCLMSCSADCGQKHTPSPWHSGVSFTWIQCERFTAASPSLGGGWLIFFMLIDCVSSDIVDYSVFGHREGGAGPLIPENSPSCGVLKLNLTQTLKRLAWKCISLIRHYCKHV